MTKILRKLPRLAYKGLTVILSNPSRFDTTSLLTANGGTLFDNFCLKPKMNLMQCDVRLAEDSSPFLEGTKCLLLLGEAAMHKYLPQTSNNSIGEMRGSPMKTQQGLWAIASFFPQDAADIRNSEAKYNPLSENYQPDFEEDREDSDDNEAVKRHGKTSRSNYAFWLRADTHKAIKIIENGGVPPIPLREQNEPHYVIHPNSTYIIDVLLKTKNRVLFFDIETDIEEQNLQCFAISFDDGPVFSVPVLDYMYRPAYHNLHLVMQALAIAIRDNLVVAHNGASFDFFVMAYKYSIGVRNCFDTMLAMHRCFPDVEKSLGHGVSYFTWQIFHKDEDSKGYMTPDQMEARLKYCGKDVYTLKLLYYAILDYARTIPGLMDSMQAAMDSIVPYLVTSLQGIKVSTEKVMVAADESDRLMMQYDRIAKLLVGDKGLHDIRSQIKGKPSMFCGSTTQQVIYFHEMLGYPVVARSAKTRLPSLGKKAMYRLALKHPDNPVIRFILAYRTKQKEFGTYKFLPWKLDDNKTNGIMTILEYGKIATQSGDTEQATLQI